MLTCKNLLASCVLLAFGFFGCIGSKQFKGPTGYDINKPEKFIMPSSLKEISGISFLNGKEDTTYAIEDETGKLYYFSVGSENVNYTKFGKKGDYEDVAVLLDKMIAVLKSDGSIILFTANQIGKKEVDSVKEYSNILPEGEYEGLYADSNKLIALCKNCPGDKGKKEVSVYTLELTNSTTLSISNTNKIDITATQPNEEKEKFHPSAISKNPITNEWYIISSVNKVLVIADQNWNVKQSYPLNPALFKQPEGLAFNKNGDMFISNEGGDGAGNILLFKYQKN